MKNILVPVFDGTGQPSSVVTPDFGNKFVLALLDGFLQE